MAGGRISPPLIVAIAALTAIALARADEIRERAEDGLGRGMPAREAALARGFVLGQDEGIDTQTEEDFERSGLSHLLAVSGQNVTLLALLALPLLGALGVPLRERLLWVLALIAVYVPLAGAGPTIQRAAVMGALGVLATLAGRRSSRLYALALAAGVTLTVDPGVAADVGWQLSFAAVLGILLLAAPLRAGVVTRIGDGGLRGALAEGVAVTVAATIATAPLIAFHFESLSTTTLLANVLAMPAVAPAMWLGMASAGAAQVPGFPLEALNWPAAVLLAYIAQVAAWLGRPEWAELRVSLSGAGLVAAYLAIAAAVIAAAALGRWRRLAASRRPVGGADPALERISLRYPRRAAFEPGWVGRAIALACVALALALWVWPGGGSGSQSPSAGLRVTVVDVGQGDAILLQPAGAAPLLVDAGPHGAGLATKLADAGVERLGALLVTHAQADHAGGAAELLGRLPIGRLLHAAPAPSLLAAARAAGVGTVRVGRGTRIRFGRLRLEVLWPPPELVAPSSAAGASGSAASPEVDPNQLAVVALASWRNFSMLLSADAEAAVVPIDPGPVDVLKVAHHGSEDAGLAALLERTMPRLAVISVGAGNPYGHPAPATLAALAAQGVRTMRTDRVGDVEIAVSGRAIVVGD